MGRYATKMCNECGIRRPINLMVAREEKVKSGNIGWGLSFNPGRKKSARIQLPRNKYSRKTVYYCKDRAAHHVLDYYGMSQKKVTRTVNTATSQITKEEDIIPEWSTIETIATYFFEKYEDPEDDAAITNDIKNNDAIIAEDSENNDEYNIILSDTGSQKFNVIREIGSVTGLGVRQCEDLVENTPTTIREGISKKEAESIKKKLEDLGASIEFVITPASSTANKKIVTNDENNIFDVILSKLGDQKILVINEVRDITGFGLKEAKDFVESAPKTIKEGISKREAQEIKRKLEDAGATIKLKPATKTTKQKKIYKDSNYDPKQKYFDLYYSENFFDKSCIILGFKIANVDGDIQEIEFTKFVENFMENSKMNRDEIHELWLMANNYSENNIISLLKRKYDDNLTAYEDIIINLLYIAEADGEIIDYEYDKIKEYAIKLGLSNDAFEKLYRRVEPENKNDGSTIYDIDDIDEISDLIDIEDDDLIDDIDD